MVNKKSAAVMNWRNRAKAKLVAYKGSKCEKCGYDKPILAAYDFHHTDPSLKEFTISGTTFKFEKIKNEVNKCQLLCKNCHAETHWLEQEPDRQQRMLEIRRIMLGVKVCKSCNKEFKPTNADRVYCGLSCSNSEKAKVKHKPSKDELAAMLWKTPTVQIAKKYDVSDNAVSKWAKAYGLKKPPRGYWGFKTEQIPT
jgi:hypothetical protein